MPQQSFQTFRRYIARRGARKAKSLSFDRPMGPGFSGDIAQHGHVMPDTYYSYSSLDGVRHCVKPATVHFRTDAAATPNWRIAGEMRYNSTLPYHGMTPFISHYMIPLRP